MGRAEFEALLDRVEGQLRRIGDDAVKKMARQVVGRLTAEDRMPPCPQAREIEIAHMRDLVLQFARRREG